MTGDVLVTGGAGFIGGHLVERLVADGRRVRVLDRREPVTGPSEWVEADVRDAAAVEAAAKGASLILHLASVVGVDALLADPVEAIDVAVNGTLRVLDAAGRADVPVIHLSTSEVLGINPAVPWAEGADRVLGSSLADRWSYGTAKATAAKNRYPPKSPDSQTISSGSQCASHGCTVSEKSTVGATRA